MAFVHAHAAGASAAAVTVPDMSASIANGDILTCIGVSYKSGGTQGAVALPAGFAIWYARTCSSFKVALGWKRANDESGDYVITSASAAETLAGISAYSGRIATGDPLDVGSDTPYITDNTTVRGAGVTIATAGSDLIWAAFCWSSANTLASPSGMTSRLSVDDPDSIELADLLNQATGATGNKDGTAGANITVNKHAFLVALKPAVTGNVTGTGALQTGAARLAGAGVVRYVGTGALVIAPAKLAGGGLEKYLGSGAVTTAAARLVGAGYTNPSGHGAVQVAPVALDGSGLVWAFGSGAVQIGPATLAGSGTSGTTHVVGSGAVTVGAVQVLGGYTPIWLLKCAVDVSMLQSANKVYVLVDGTAIVGTATNTTISPTYAERPREMVEIIKGGDLAAANAVAALHLAIRQVEAYGIQGLQVPLRYGLGIQRGMKVAVGVPRAGLAGVYTVRKIQHDFDANITTLGVGDYQTPLSEKDVVISLAKLLEQLRKEAAV